MINVYTHDDAEGNVKFLVVEISAKNIPVFKQLVQRATNVWDTAPPVIKEFADVITVGHIQQDYFNQDTSPR